MSVASPRQHTKAKNTKKARLSPNQCREVTEHWKSCLGEGKAKALVGKYTNPTRLPSTKDSAHHVRTSLTHHLHHDWSVSSAHSNTGGRRNPGRNDGLTWNGDSFICPDQIGVDYDSTDIDPLFELCPVCEEQYSQEALENRPRTVEISLGDIPVRVRKPKQRKAHGYELLPPIPRVSPAPPSEFGEPSFYPDFETMSNFSWDAMGSDDLSVFSEEDWEDLDSTHPYNALGHELGRDPKFLQISRNDMGSPSATPPQRTYAQALGL